MWKTSMGRALGPRSEENAQLLEVQVALECCRPEPS